MNLNTASAQVVTIDGPSGAGKGTLSQLVARNLGYHLLDSGALYRLVALAAMDQSADLSDQNAIARVASSLDVRFDVSGEQVVILLEERDVSRTIREEAVSKSASIVAAYPAVREALLERQRDFRQAPGLVADGRDMGTTVFPDAEVKVFLTASPEARAQRRFKQLRDQGMGVNLDELVADIRERDKRDSERSISPLKPAEDAYVLDSTDLSIGQVLAEILARVQNVNKR